MNEAERITRAEIKKAIKENDFDLLEKYLYNEDYFTRERALSCVLDVLEAYNHIKKILKED